MSAKIEGLINESSFEVVRREISAILAVEIANQWSESNALPPNTPGKLKFNKPTVFEELTKKGDRTLLPMINVIVGTQSNDGDDLTFYKGDTTYYIDCYTSAPGNDGSLSMKQTHRLAGLVAKILMSGHYKALGLPGIVLRRELRDIRFAEPNETGAESVTSVRVELNVSMNEVLDTSQAPIVGRIQHVVKLQETDLGYIWQTDNNT